VSAERTVAPGTGQVFLRQASGLVRTAAPYDVFIFNIGLISVGIAVALDQLYGPSLYPGANVALSSIIAMVGMVVVGLAYYMWSVTFPRSGGNYVYQSRALHPSVAFATTFMETVILMFYAALAASLLATVGLSAGFAVLGFIAESNALADMGVWFGSPIGVFIMGTLFIIFSGLLPLFGMRRYFSFQRIMFIVAIIGTIVALAVLLFGSRDTFVTNWNQLTGLEYATVISTAIANEWPQGGLAAGPTVAFLVWPLLPLLGGIQSIGIGGEIKKVSRAQSYGILGSILVAGVVFVAFALLSDRVFGYDFQGAVAFNALSGIAEASPEVTPWFTFLAGILTDNVLWTVLIVAGFAAWIYFWIPAELIYGQRTMLAWSFDRLAPGPLGYVSPRFHTPVVAIVITVLLSIAFMWVIAYTTYGTLVLIFGVLACWGTTMLAGVFFPWSRKAMFERSPVANWRVGPLPAFSVVNFLALAFMAWVFYLLWNDPIAAGHDAVDIWPWVALLAGGFVIYVITAAVRRRQGIRLELAFKEIPIE
jgi:APA family basic amino acid/polyamine antiporter